MKLQTARIFRRNLRLLMHRAMVLTLGVAGLILFAALVLEAWHAIQVGQ